MSNAMEKHEKFILDDVLPSIFAHSAKVECGSVETALAVFMALGTILQEQGVSADTLLAAIRCSALSTHDAPEGLQ
ncbi:hypothetical protein [Pusillimonas noertemannii]|uniref:Uncharacterized protein n=1 Tax=Pusillimonas noertemannii TaxID=305977 RepID=A0A2U1CR68_9BURK|nr:hypothetical protein [Pusillimonas noertemannii]NYT67702.1 hypothetical protein [Pusillimonas noertemannii]PVY68373.1 hypothetical protein C7440_0770 [Pusillimonas noertemannii]TFL12142.1 hypothetical protein CSC72_03200 [Pusillimonas noertemannii]